MNLAAFFGPGSILWLLRHDLRLGHRGMRSSKKRSGKIAIGILITLVVLLHVAGFAAAPVLDALHDQFRAESLMAGSVALASVFALFMSKAISQSTDALYDRGDLDLLLSSPLPMRRVLTTRLLAIAVVSAFMPIVIAVPIVNGMVLRGYFAWVGVYPVIISLGLTAASLGSAITFGLLAWLGPRWTSVVARVAATALGMAALLISQLRLLFPTMTSSDTWVSLTAQARAGAHGLMWWPTRALIGDTVPMLALLALTFGALMLVSGMLGRAYAYGVLGHLAIPAARSATSQSGVFDGTPTRTLLYKEAVLLLRHPGLAANLLYQAVFLVPGVIMAKRVSEATGSDVHAAVVLLTVMMTGRIARIIAAGPFGGDQAAGLAASSPIPSRSVLLAKVAATASVLAGVVGASLLMIWVEVPAALPATAIAASGAAAFKVWLATGQELPLRRVGLHGRFAGDSTALPGFISDLCWGLGGVALTLVF